MSIVASIASSHTLIWRSRGSSRNRGKVWTAIGAVSGDVTARVGKGSCVAALKKVSDLQHALRIEDIEKKRLLISKSNVGMEGIKRQRPWPARASWKDTELSSLIELRS